MSSFSGIVVLLLWASAGFSQCGDIPPGMTNYNAVIFGNHQLVGGDVEGRLAVAGDFTATAASSIGIAVIGPSLQEPYGDTLVVEGTIDNQSGSSWEVRGNAVYGVAFQGTAFSHPSGYSTRGPETGVLDFATALVEIRDRSAYWAGLEDNGTVSDNGWGTITFTGTDPDLNIFTMDPSGFPSWGATLNFNVPAGSTVLVNVKGEDLTFTGGSMTESYKEKLLFNFYEATNIVSQTFAWHGAMVAPFADFTFQGGQINGRAVIGGNVTQGQSGAEFHNFSYTGDLPCPPTLVYLSSFGASAVDGRVFVEWTVAEEYGTAGFYLERSRDGVWERVFDGLIPPFGNGFYSIPDPGAAAGGAYVYRLLELETDGRLRVLGPYAVATGEALTLNDWSRKVFTAEQRDRPEVSNPDADPDGDGLTNRQEFLAGTAPTSAASVFALSSCRKLDGDVVRIEWSSVPGAVYRIESSDSPGGPFAVIRDGIRATPPKNAVEIAAPGSGTLTVYRVRVEMSD